MIDSFKLALSFLTILPVKFKNDIDSQTFGKAIAFFPLIGIIIGAILSALWYLLVLKIGVGKNVASVILVIALIATTRMLHLDGLADTFDGLFGGKNSDHSLTIMKDSRVGSFGVIAIVSTLLAKFALLGSLEGLSSIGTILLFPVIGRFAACYAMITQPYARQDGLGALFSKGRKATELFIPTVFTVAIAFAAQGINGILALLGSLLLTVVILRWVKGKIGGITGDIVGAIIEISEISLLLMANIAR